MSHSISFSRLLKSERILDRCPKCGRRLMVIDSSRGELFCSNCGFVMKEKIVEVGPELRSFSKEEKDNRSRTGSRSSITMHDMGLGAVIGCMNKAASGRSLSGSMTATVGTLAMSDRRVRLHE